MFFRSSLHHINDDNVDVVICKRYFIFQSIYYKAFEKKLFELSLEEFKRNIVENQGIPRGTFLIMTEAREDFY